jgi:hypothetical protein
MIGARDQAEEIRWRSLLGCVAIVPGSFEMSEKSANIINV